MSKTSIFKLIIVIFISSISLQESSAAGEGRFKTAAKKLQNMISHTGQALTTPRKLRKSAAGIGLRRELARIEPSKQENDWSKQSYLVNSRHGSSNCCRPSGYVEFANYRWTLLKSLDSNTHLYYSRFGQLRKLVGSNTGTTIAGLKRLWPRDYGKYDLSFDTVNKLATHNLNVFENGGIPIIQTEERIVLPPPM